MFLFLPIPEIETTIDKNPYEKWIPVEVPEWDPDPVKAGLGPVLPIPPEEPSGRDVAVTVRLNGRKKVLVRIGADQPQSH